MQTMPNPSQMAENSFQAFLYSIDTSRFASLADASFSLKICEFHQTEQLSTVYRSMDYKVVF